MSMTSSTLNFQMKESLRQMKFAHMEKGDLEAVLRIENSIYPFPWSLRNFADSIDSGYETWVIRDAFDMIAGYFLMMMAVDEAHLLNITVRLDLQSHGIGRLLLNKAISLAQEKRMRSLLLEVRPSNQHALAVYQHVGFRKIGTRKNYYPAPHNTREDAIVMRLEI